MSTTLLQGDCLTVLKTLPDQSAQTCVTSPPYFGLRDYGTAMWDGGDPSCEHRVRDARTVSGGSGKQYTNLGSNCVFSGDCVCGANRADSQVGLEETPEQYVQKLVAIFHEVKRVLSDDGTLWLNLGDSYAGSGKGRNSDGTHSIGGKQDTNVGTNIGQLWKVPDYDGLKQKDLVGIPWTVAFALRADGWYLRSDIIWHKPNPMPESVTDRPTKAHEYIFLLSKSPRYYYDAEAVKEPATSKFGRGAIGRGAQASAKAVGANGRQPQQDHSGWLGGDGETRSRRSVWTVPTKPYKGAHFATYPPDLIRPCILAGAPKDGIVLDPFSGSGTTGQVCVEEGRFFLGIELNPAYIQLAHERIAKAIPKPQQLPFAA